MEYFDLKTNHNIKEFNIDEQIFNDLIELLIMTFKTLNINIDDKNIYYERSNDGKSILAIKVLDGEDFIKANYMFIGCEVSYPCGGINCNVYMYAGAPSSSNSIKISNMYFTKLFNFFKEIETDLLNKNLINLEVSFKMPLVKRIDEISKVKRFFRKIVNGIQNIK